MAPMTEPENRLLWDRGRLASPHAQSDKSIRVRRMFDAIAPTYERVNSLFSLGRDRTWRKRSVASSQPTRDDRVLDIACGTGDLARAFRRHPNRPRTVVGCDFSRGMLEEAAGRDGGGDIRWLTADALALPFASSSFNVTSCAFGVRNFADLDAGLREMHRVLVPGGRAVILEFTRPANRAIRCAYELYAMRVMPLAATLVSGDRTGAYRYLPRSVVSFPDARAMCRRLSAAGFETVTATAMTLGIVTVYVATK